MDADSVKEILRGLGWTEVAAKKSHVEVACPFNGMHVMRFSADARVMTEWACDCIDTFGGTMLELVWRLQEQGSTDVGVLRRTFEDVMTREKAVVGSAAGERPLDRVVHNPRLRGVKRINDKKYKALCPAHNDHDPSLGIDEAADGRVLLFCRSHHCSLDKILKQLDLEKEDLFADEIAPTAQAAYKADLKARFNSAGFRPFAGNSGFDRISSAPTNGKANVDSWMLLPELDEGTLLKMREHVRDARPWAYLQSPKRRLLPETIGSWELGYHPATHRIAIPIRDHKGRLVGISGRVCPIHDPELDQWIEVGKGPKFMHSEGFKRDFCLYGEHMIKGRTTGYIVEGFFDVIGLWQSGYYNAVAIMGTSLSRQQVEKIAHYFTDVVVVPDGDKAGVEMGARLTEQLQGLLPVRVVEMPSKADPDDLSVKQLNDLLGPRTVDNRTLV